MSIRFHLLVETQQRKLHSNRSSNGRSGKRKSALKVWSKENDLIYVSGVIGDAFLQLKKLKKLQNQDIGFDAYLHPKAQIELGLELVDIASSAIDISDGLIPRFESRL